ncbi:MAG: formylglycine-generating enzyme family protein [Lentisphaerae bacterium]|nr:formylglycine-generating enzyme family protein [Lentisphaerota bacterium]
MIRISIRTILILIIGLFPNISLLKADEDNKAAPVGSAVPNDYVLPEKRQGAEFKLDIGGRQELVFVWIDALKMWVGKFEVSNGQYKQYNSTERSQHFYKKNINYERQPAVNVSWFDAVNFCSWLNRRFSVQLESGFGFRLPSESEWEIFASCGDERVFPWGSEWPPPDKYNYRGEEGTGFLFRLFEHDDIIKGHRDDFIVGAPIDQSGENDWGLFGVAGNVWEWCSDVFSDEFDQRVLKGGAWNTSRPENMKVKSKAGTPAEWKNAMIGFRVVLAPAH